MINKFILDVDGVMTDGKIYYSETGKMFKVFGAHDHDGLKLLQNFCEFEFVTADRAGAAISKARLVDHMGYKLSIIGEQDRLQWFKDNFDLATTAYMADGIFDAQIFPHVAVSIAPQNARIEAKKAATFVTDSASSEGAVLDACLYLINRINNEKL